jgi:hypothetical protein
MLLQEKINGPDLSWTLCGHQEKEILWSPNIELRLVFLRDGYEMQSWGTSQ